MNDILLSLARSTSVRVLLLRAQSMIYNSEDDESAVLV